MKNSNKFNRFLKVSLFVMLSGFMASANATIWNVDAVLQGTDSNYGYSSFHDATTGSVMSGGALGDITGVGALGTFNDATGYLDIVVSSGGGSTHIFGTLDFGGMFGFLATDSGLDIDFGTPVGLLVDTFITMQAGELSCCTGATGNATPGNAPNSFTAVGAGAIITLWGANGYLNGAYHNQSNPIDDPNVDIESPTTVGMDLRLQLSRVPEPSSLLLMGVGLLGLFARRRLS